MKRAISRITAQGQISIPAEVRRHLGLAAGSMIEWDLRGNSVVVRRAARQSSEDVHRALFPKPARTRTLEELKEGVRTYVRSRHARG